MKTVFSVPIRPTSKARPRFGQGHAYTPKRTREYENMIASFYNRTMNPKHTGNVSLTINFMFACPASWTKKQRAEAYTTGVPHMSKPDIDNLIKAVLDALNGIAWNDDKQIASLVATKVYGATDCIQVIIES